jgi:ankyrin repeat protein
MSDSEEGPAHKEWTHVTLKDLQGACDRRNISDACDMLNVAPHLALEAVKIRRLSDGQGLLHVAAAGCHHNQLALLLGLVRVLQEKDADNPSLAEDIRLCVDAQDKQGRTALHAAASAERPLSEDASVLCASSLIDAGACSSAVDLRGQVPMHRACDAGNLAMVTFLIKISIMQHDLRVSDLEGFTALLLAARAGFTEICRLILDVADDAIGQHTMMHGTNFQKCSKSATTVHLTVNRA